MKTIERTINCIGYKEKEAEKRPLFAGKVFYLRRPLEGAAGRSITLRKPM